MKSASPARWGRLLRIAVVTPLVILCVYIVGVIVVGAFQKGLWSGVVGITFILVWCYMRWLLNRPERRETYGLNDDDDGEEGGAGVPSPLRPRPPVLHAADAKPWPE
jgi:hypothetical protein